MKKFLAASVLALALVSGSQQTASAWGHYKFSIGMNIDWATGNNTWLWGALHNGQIPDGYGYGGGPLGDHHAGAPMTYGQPGFTAPAPTPVQQRGAPGTSSSMLAGYPANYYYYYPASYGSYYPQAQYYPMSYYQPSTYYYPVNYGHGFSFGR